MKIGSSHPIAHTAGTTRKSDSRRDCGSWKGSTTLLGILAAATLLCSITPARALEIKPLAQGVLPSGDNIFTVQVTLNPGEEFGWHYHTGPAWGVMQSGVLTEDEGCGSKLNVYNPGQAFAEEPGRVHNVYNHGTEPVVLLWTEIYPSCLEHTVMVPGGPTCEGKSGKSHLVKIPHCP